MNSSSSVAFLSLSCLLMASSSRSLSARSLMRRYCSAMNQEFYVHSRLCSIIAVSCSAQGRNGRPALQLSEIRPTCLCSYLVLLFLGIPPNLLYYGSFVVAFQSLLFMQNSLWKLASMFVRAAFSMSFNGHPELPDEPTSPPPTHRPLVLRRGFWFLSEHDL